MKKEMTPSAVETKADKQPMDLTPADIENKEIRLEDKRFNIQLKKGEKMFLFSVPDGTPYGEAYDACLEILVALSGMINEATKKVTPQVVDPVVENQTN